MGVSVLRVRRSAVSLLQNRCCVRPRASQIRHLIAALERRCSQLARVAPLRSQKAPLRMRIGTVGRAMVPAHCFLDLAQNRNPLRARLTLPEQDEALAANTAMELGISLRAFAKNFHVVSLPVRDGFSHPAGHNSQ